MADKKDQHIDKSKRSEMAGQDGRPHYTGIRFDGTNFDSWQFGVRLVLQSEELWTIVKGNEMKPQPIINEERVTNTAAISAWDKKNISAMRIIYSSIQE
ncbi:hypothetical protein OUZ56_005941 [Daphnia magna]|uniref:Retrotransposon Copia-like N-terminal domain-containing protein n=1 Tax=Daphnia magna TaxID=35525 RepID=A0ABQ9YU64_9CRUS|nr:hypothetical protein OUZ56_005941 [Daphnia magna]